MNEYLEFAKEIAAEASKVMLRYFNEKDISHYKGDNTIVTLADTEINQMLIDRVREKYPNHGVNGEEQSADNQSENLWVCDPVDGTAMFARGIPVAVFSLAFVVDGEPQVGVVYDPFTDRLYEAAKGQGAFCNGEPIHVSDVPFGDKREISNFDLWPESELYPQISALLAELHQKSYLVSLGSCINACMQVARGSFSAQIFAGTHGKNVDIAAAKVIVEEAGGRVTNIYGEDQRYDRDIQGAIVTNGIVHDAIIDTIKENLK